jgi:hypothetical protein
MRRANIFYFTDDGRRVPAPINLKISASLLYPKH